MIPNYPKVVHLGSRDTALIWDDPVVVQEKIDGSQFRAYVNPETDKLHFFSRGGERLSKDTLFGPAMATFEELKPKLLRNVVYCGEAVAKPKHNIVAYERVPQGNVALFDCMFCGRLDEVGGNPWAEASWVAGEAERLGIEAVTIFFEGNLSGPAGLEAFLQGASALGGIKEGVVVKNYTKGIFAKYVAPQFHEVKGSKAPKPKAEGWDGFLETLANKYGGEARRHKAFQHLRDEGLLVDGPEDIGPLIKELQKDLLEECVEDLKDELWARASGPILKQVAPKMAAWYRNRLAIAGSATEEAGYGNGNYLRGQSEPAVPREQP